MAARVPHTARPRGLYVHVPFCFHKCHYCDFYSVVDRRDRQGAFVERLVAELDAIRPILRAPLETVFIGGGTPTLLAPGAWGPLGAAVHDLSLAGGVEWTVEANPETVTEENARALAAAGVNRVSVGCQSFDPRHLATLERWHEPASVPRAVDRLREAGIGRINLDLIFGIPGQSVGEWADDLEHALTLEPDHLSCYALTFEPGTAMTARRRAGRIRPVEEDAEVAMYELTIDRLAAEGYEHYEISNWARPGERCRHNLLYWTNADWWAAGPAAAGHLDGLRWRNVPRLTEYLEHGPWPPIVDVEAPDPSRRVGETLMLGIRLLEGMRWGEVERLLEQDPAGADRRRRAINAHTAEGRLERGGDRLRLALPGGVLLADGIAADLL